jgi:hypothetical protein
MHLGAPEVLSLKIGTKIMLLFIILNYAKILIKVNCYQILVLYLNKSVIYAFNNAITHIWNIWLTGF